MCSEMAEEITEILPNQLYLTGVHCRHEEELLGQLGITVICDLSNQSNLPQYDGITYYRFSIIDSENENITPIMEEIYQIHQSCREEGRLLIHCMHGVSRSATCAIYCLMKQTHRSLKQSFQEVKSKRSVVLPNVGFMNQLIAAEIAIFGQSSLAMGKYGQFMWLN